MHTACDARSNTTTNRHANPRTLCVRAGNARRCAFGAKSSAISVQAVPGLRDYGFDFALE
eukprot:2144362-Rhodomonas_salina.1